MHTRCGQQNNKGAQYRVRCLGSEKPQAASVFQILRLISWRHPFNSCAPHHIRIFGKVSAASFSSVKWRQSRCSLTSVQMTQTIRHLPVIGEEQSSPKSAVMLEHSLELPGAFPHYCWRYLNQNRLAICDHHPTKFQEQPALCNPL